MNEYTFLVFFKDMQKVNLTMHNFNKQHMYTAWFYFWACKTAGQTIFMLIYWMATIEIGYPKRVMERVVHALNERSSHGEELSLALSLLVCHKLRELDYYGNIVLYLSSATEVLF